MAVIGWVCSIKCAGVVGLITILCLHPAASCDGYRMKFHYTKNCPGIKSVIRAINVTGLLDGDCYFIPRGCISTNSGFKTAMIEYSISRNNLAPLRGIRDVCMGLGEAQKDTVAILRMMGAPTSCPVLPKSVTCGSKSKKIDASKLKPHLHMIVGTIEANATIKHDVGQTCLTSKFDIYRIAL